MGLHAGTVHEPGLGSPSVGEMAHEPVAGDRGRHPGEDAPRDPGPAAAQIERQSDWQLMGHPGALHEAVEPAASDLGIRVEFGWPGQVQTAMQLPDRVDQHRPTMREIVVAARLPLGPVAGVVNADHAEGAVHADGCSEPDQHRLDPARAVEAPVDEAPMKAHRVAQEQRRSGGEDEDSQGAPGQRRGA